MPTRTLRLSLCLLLFAGGSLLSPKPAHAEETPPPNVIFILTDDQRWDALGCMGNEFIRTPQIDRLAAEGVRFTHMFCTTSICAISRASFITGQYERRHGIDNFSQPLSPEQFAATFPALLRKAGYRTGLVGKWGLGGPLPKDQYDYFTGYSGQGRYFPPDQKGEPGHHLTAKLGQEALDFLDSCTDDQPFLLQLYTKAPHCQDGDPWPFQPDPRYNDLFADVELPLPATASERHFANLPEFLQTSEARRRWQVRFADAEMYQKSVKDYYRLIAGIDDVVGQIVNKLRERNWADRTVIIFTSDNGFYLGEHGLAGKWFMHEESIRLPLVVYDPRLPQELRGRAISELVLNIDVAPSILEWAGLDIPEEIQGRSFVPLVHRKNATWRTDFLYEHRFTHGAIPQTEGVRGDRWKFVRYISVDPPYEELFDLENDPHEERNLAENPEFADTLNAMRQRWQVLRKEAE